MRFSYLICYDICDDKRLRQVFQTMRGFRDHLQFSIFECQLTATDLARCRAALAAIIHHTEDQVLFVNLGPAAGRGDRVIAALGKPYTAVDAPCIIVLGVLVGALPIQIETKRELPDYLPARMVNEYAYCPRLFFYEWVEGLLAESVNTVEGSIQHRRVDAKATARPDAGELPQSIHSRSVQLSSERLRVIAKMDLVEVEDGVVTPVDYKHGHPRDGSDGLELWPADRAQLGVQGIVLRENGYRCDEGVAYYRKTGQRVRAVFDEALIAETEALILEAWGLAESGEIPAPLMDSPKYPGCSLVGICLPDETWRAAGEGADEPPQLALFGWARGQGGGGGGGGRAAAPGAVRCAAGQAGEAGSPGDDDAAKRTASAVSEHAGGEDREERGGAAGAGYGEASTRGEDRRDLSGESDGERADHDAGGAVAVRGGGAGLLLLDGRVVLRDHAGVEYEKRVLEAEPVPAGGAGVFREDDCAAAGGGEDSQSENAVAAESRGTEAGDAGGDEGDGGAGGGGGVAGGVAGDRGECGAAVLRGVRGDDEAGRGGGDESAAVRDGRAEPAAAEGSGELDAVAGVQLVGEGPDGGVLRGGVRPVRGVLSSAAVRTAGAGAGFDGAISGLNRGFGGADGGEYGDGDGAGFREGRGRGGTDGGREEGIFPGVRDADGYAGDASVVRVPGELPAVAGDPGAVVGARIGGGDCGIPGVYDAVVWRERRVGAG